MLLKSCSAWCVVVSTMTADSLKLMPRNRSLKLLPDEALLQNSVYELNPELNDASLTANAYESIEDFHTVSNAAALDGVNAGCPMFCPGVMGQPGAATD